MGCGRSQRPAETLSQSATCGRAVARNETRCRATLSGVLARRHPGNTQGVSSGFAEGSAKARAPLRVLLAKRATGVGIPWLTVERPCDDPDSLRGHNRG